VHHLGLTGHHDPAILLEAMRRFEFDTLLVALNAADVHRLSFVQTVLPEAVRQGMGVIGMKVYGAGTLVGPGKLTTTEAMGYVLSLAGVSTVIIGCATPDEVEQNARASREAVALDEAERQTLEERTRLRAPIFTGYKRPA
jgi:predicted aldo/keto reductase-like oxidoreductase